MVGDPVAVSAMMCNWGHRVEIEGYGCCRQYPENIGFDCFAPTLRSGGPTSILNSKASQKVPDMAQCAKVEYVRYFRFGLNYRQISGDLGYD